MKIRHLGLRNYASVLNDMVLFTHKRGPETEDEVWICQHPPVYTIGAACRPDDYQNTLNIEIVKSDRGGKITYHGPGQLVCYPLIDLRRAGLYPKAFLSEIHEIILDFLKHFNLKGELVTGAPGVYLPLKGGENEFTGLAKVASVGLKISNHHTYHGFSINVDMDLEPFRFIDPCGYKGLRVVDLKSYFSDLSLQEAEESLTTQLRKHFGEVCRTKND